MERERVCLAVGIGAIVAIGIAGLVYQLFGTKSKVEREVKTVNMRDCPAATDRSPRDPADDDDNGDDDDDDDNESAGDSDDKTARFDDALELAAIPQHRLKNHKPLLPGHVDAADYLDDQSHPHRVLLQYCAAYPDRLPVLDVSSKLVGRPLGRVQLDDGTGAIVYRGDAAYVLFGPGDRADRLALVQGILEAVLEALLLLAEHGHMIGEEELMHSVAVNAAGTPRLLGLHGCRPIGGDEREQAVAGAFYAVAAKCLSDELRWSTGTGEHDQAQKLHRDLQSTTKVNILKKRLAVHPGGSHSYHHHQHRHHHS